MPERRTHRVTTSDGVTIGGTVRGQGPTLVLLQGVIGDGDLDWGPTKPFFTASAGHVTEHVPHARVHQVPGAGHAAPITHPGTLAGALAEFFTATPQPV